MTDGKESSQIRTSSRKKTSVTNRRSYGWLWVGSLLLIVYSGSAAEWRWRQLTTNAPVTSSLYTRVFWTGHELLVWGAHNPKWDKPYVHVAWRWNPRTGGVKWMSLSNAPAVPAFGGQTVVWTGRYLLAWGGLKSGYPESASKDGYCYDPLGDSWQKISAVDAPTRRQEHGAVWTGREMVVWGGYFMSKSGTGYDLRFPPDFGAYDPEANRWRKFSGDAGPKGRRNPALVFTGNNILMWGGWDMRGGIFDMHNVYFEDLYQMDLPSGEWTVLQPSGVPSGRDECGTVWTGHEFIIWGGFNGRSFGSRTLLSDGARFRPSENSWVSMSPSSPLGPRDYLDAVWNGSEVIFWGGLNAMEPGARYDPRLDSWTPIATNGAPAYVQSHNTVWAGDTLLAVGDDVFALGPTGPFGGDFLPDEWQGHFFATNPSSAGPSQDPDGDGWSNEWEWRFGTDPSLSNSHPIAEIQIQMNAGQIRVSFPDPDPLLRITLLTSVRLDQPFRDSTAVETRSGGRVLWRITPLPEDSQFFRVMVTAPN